MPLVARQQSPFLGTPLRRIHHGPLGPTAATTRSCTLPLPDLADPILSGALAYFVKIAELGSLTVAARALRISQPSRTVAVKRLEEELGLLQRRAIRWPLEVQQQCIRMTGGHGTGQRGLAYLARTQQRDRR